MQQLIWIRELKQVDTSYMEITWSDGVVSSYHLGLLQSYCPCTQCRDAKPQISKEVSAKAIVSVGNYALRIAFTEGCSFGIYPFSLLRKLQGGKLL